MPHYDVTESYFEAKEFLHPQVLRSGYSLRNPVAEVGRKPAGHDLIGVVVPEEVDLSPRFHFSIR